MHKHTFNKKYSLFLGTVGIIVVFAIIAITTDFSSVISAISGVNLALLLAAVAAQIFSYLCLTEKLKTIAGEYKKISYLTAFKTWLIGALLDLITPFIQVGGEPLKIFMLKKKGLSFARASAIIAADTFIELFAFFTMLVVSMLLLILTTKSPVAIFSYILGVVMAALLISLAFFVVLNKSLLKKSVLKIESITKRFGYNVKEYSRIVISFESMFRSLLRKEKLITETFLLSIGAKLFDFVRIYFVFAALGYPIGFDTILFAWSIVLILSMLPGLPGNLGVIEAGAIAAYVLFGVPAPIAAAAIILDRLISFWMLVGIGGIIFGSGFKNTAKKVRKEAKK